jgi:hypothetical protein
MHRGRASAVRRHALLWRRLLAAVMAAPLSMRLFVATAIILFAGLAINWVYQTIRKPTELFFPISGAFVKTPAETWRQYGSLFREHSTSVITPELLAALAQVEGGGNPVARTYWRARPTWNPLEVYRPASSAVGMFQITDATFRDAKRYCVRSHKVVEEGPWHDMKSCWFNSLYTRVLPSHAIELTAAHLDRGVAGALGRRRIGATLQQKQNTAAVIHLCGATAGRAYAARGFKPTPRLRCGDHDVNAYLSRVNAMKRQFVRLAVGERVPRLVAGN